MKAFTIFFFEIFMHFKKTGENTFQQAWQSLKFVCFKFRTKLNLPPVQALFCAGKTPLACSEGEERLSKTQKMFWTLNNSSTIILFSDEVKSN